MSKESKEQQLDQLLRGVYRMCVNRDDCNGCPFYITKCTFEEPKPSTWFDEETIEISAPVEAEKPVEQEVAESPAEPVAPAVTQPVAQPAAADDSDGTWLVSTTMGSVFTKYVFICSKCGYKKESIFSMTPITFCPECEKKKAAQT
jgi:hypothetical protein